jgi:hypothetical protein
MKTTQFPSTEPSNKPPPVKKGGDDEASNRNIIIGATIGGVVFIFLVGYFFYSRVTPTKHATINAVEVAVKPGNRSSNATQTSHEADLRRRRMLQAQHSTGDFHYDPNDQVEAIPEVTDVEMYNHPVGFPKDRLRRDI